MEELNKLLGILEYAIKNFTEIVKRIIDELDERLNGQLTFYVIVFFIITALAKIFKIRLNLNVGKK